MIPETQTQWVGPEICISIRQWGVLIRGLRTTHVEQHKWNKEGAVGRHSHFTSLGVGSDTTQLELQKGELCHRCTVGWRCRRKDKAGTAGMRRAMVGNEDRSDVEDGEQYT